ncbi:hypothetical protein N665_0030s0094 [Sinapis alba]|nr:hypothetical protein N665_0030s0094 [Sinapis alba]
MAMFSHRLRRALLTAAACINRSISPASLAPRHDFPSVSKVLQRSVLGRFTEATQSPVRLFSTREYKLFKEGDEITQDTVLFEGCDYNHWLTNLSGVVFILPDSYIDPQTKEYGDKYENGVITHRPPPFQPIRRPRDKFSQRSDRQGGSEEENSKETHRGYGGSQQSYGAPGQGTQAPSPPFQGGYNQGYIQGPARSQPPPYQGDYNQGQGFPVPPYQGGPGNYSQGLQGGYNQGGPRNYNPQGNENYGPMPGGGSPNPGFGQDYSGPGQEQSQTFQHSDQKHAAGDWNNNNQAGHPGYDQFPQGRRY